MSMQGVSLFEHATRWGRSSLPLIPKIWVQPRPPALKPLEDRLWSDTEVKMTSPLSSRRVLLLGPVGPRRAAVRDMLQEIGVRMTAMVGSARHLATVVELAASFDCVMIDFDAFDDVEDGVDALLDFRRKCPGIAVVLLSSSVGGDDLSSERAAITDATVRLPATGDRLSRALSCALENHASALELAQDR